jgi:hypothetical protein
MRKIVLSLIVILECTLSSFSQSKSTLKGIVNDNTGKPLQAVTIALLKAKDSSLLKVEISNAEGKFEFSITEGNYLLSYNLIGYEKKYSTPFEIKANQSITIKAVSLITTAKKLQDVTVVSKKPLIEVKADKTVFNVEAGVTATGSNALELLQKSPGIQVDNNDNISMKGKTGVRIYIDGKLMEFDNKTLADFLKTIQSNDIEAIEMIDNPSAKYDASGNAGIINIRLKKNKSFGTNGSANGTFTQGVTPKANGSVSLNYRNKKVNVFGNVGAYTGRNENAMDFFRIQKDTLYDQHALNANFSQNINSKVGTDFFLNKKNTIGFVATSNFSNSTSNNTSTTNIYYNPTGQYIKQLQATNTVPANRNNVRLNLNYRYADTTGTEINVDADYGLFKQRANSIQPNYYYDKFGNPTYTVINKNNTPIDINIYTAKIDVEQNAFKGKIGYGAKFSYVKTQNTFDFYTVQNGVDVHILDRSNNFVYKENVNAAYINYNRQFNNKWSLQAGLRMEQTNSEGLLTRADGIIQADNNVKRNYLDFFPSTAITYNINKKHTLNLTYSRRIDRPTYQNLNPFETKIDELTYQKGNAFLLPQYTDNVALTHTFMGFINTSASYSYVKDYATQVTDTVNNATYIQQHNLATQQIIGLNIGAPLPIKKWWNGYINIYYNYQIFDGKISNNTIHQTIPIYGLYMQNSFTLGNNYTLEVSGNFNGPNIWGATWKTKSQGGVDIGLQKLLMNKKATLKIAATDIFFTQPWTATSDFGGLYIHGKGSWESRTLRISFSYRFGSNQIKAARQRKTGSETEANRIGS